jgi:hypothetical protein
MPLVEDKPLYQVHDLMGAQSLGAFGKESSEIYYGPSFLGFLITMPFLHNGEDW